MIKDKQLLLMYESAKTIIPDYFYTVPSSSSGKYYPKFALGEGGLVRHTQFAVDIAIELFPIYNFSDYEKDVILLSLALHDTFKCGLGTGTSSTHKLHAKIAADEYRKLWSELEVDEKCIGDVCGCIESHMGQWGERKPESKVEKFVHLCDMVASRKVMDKYYIKGEC